MEYLYQKIAEIVEKEEICLEEFLKLLVEQQQHLVENDIDRLKEGVARQQELIAQIKGFEKGRLELVAKYSELLNLDPKEITISNMARRAGGELSDKLMELQSSLLSLHQKIEKAKRKNQFLIEHSMKYIEGTIKLIAGSVASKNDYAPREEQKSVILSRTV